ncbi:DUF881 domain-containing protein [Georgenia halophila]|uniref:DUF881 domain-containing protein n=1 Tax=Georgenia halophila TaxID=620889 RepID=A0ABP8L9S2_9MICO
MTDDDGTTSSKGARPGSERPEGADRTARSRRVLRSLVVARVSVTHVIVALLCVGLGFAVVAQVRQTQGDAMTGMRQDDLVRLLDELTRRNEQLEAEQEQLQQDLAALRSSATSREAAQEAAELRAVTRGVLAGTVPVHGPGITLTISDPGHDVQAQVLVTVVEELRNAGAEAIELSGQRLAADSWILDDPDGGVVVDGESIDPPYRWTAVGEPHALAVALNIPGGALASIRNAGASASLTEAEDVEITAVRDIDPAEVATPVESDGEG